MQDFCKIIFARFFRSFYCFENEMTLKTEIMITPLARVKVLPHIVFNDIYRVAILTTQSFQSCNKSLINQACSGTYWANIGPRSFLYGPRCAQSVLSRPRTNIRPVRPSRVVNKIYMLILLHVFNFFCSLRDTVLLKSKLTVST